MGSDTVPLPMNDACERVLSDISDKESMFIRHEGDVMSQVALEWGYQWCMSVDMERVQCFLSFKDKVEKPVCIRRGVWWCHRLPWSRAFSDWKDCNGSCHSDMGLSIKTRNEGVMSLVAPGATLSVQWCKWMCDDHLYFSIQATEKYSTVMY